MISFSSKWIALIPVIIMAKMTREFCQLPAWQRSLCVNHYWASTSTSTKWWTGYRRKYIGPDPVRNPAWKSIRDLLFMRQQQCPNTNHNNNNRWANQQHKCALMLAVWKCFSSAHSWHKKCLHPVASKSSGTESPIKFFLLHTEDVCVWD